MPSSSRPLLAGLTLATLVAASAAAPVPTAPAPTAPPPRVPSSEIENLAAFARLYGVVRWFYPGDAAASLDWNRFAVLGVRRVRGARSPAELAATLDSLFAPLGPGLLIGATLPPIPPVGARNPALVAWHYRGPGFSEIGGGTYTARRINRPIPVAPSQQTAASILTQGMAADTLRGRAVRLRGRVRVADANGAGWAGLWLRVDRPNNARGFFDNMQDRPVRDTAWREYVIEGTIAPDATQLYFGALSVGEMRTDVDAIELSVRRADGAWVPLAIRDADFDNAADANPPAWAGNRPTPFPRLADGVTPGSRFVRLLPASAYQAASREIARATDSLETPVTGAVSDFVLARGLRARVALSLTDAEARTAQPALAALRTAIAALPQPGRSDETDVRLADVVVAWSVLRHFSPYWRDLAVDWDARLRPQLAAALAAAPTRAAHDEMMRRLVAELNDGHGNVSDIAVPRPLTILPLTFRILAERLVVTASADSAVPVGSVITRINGTPASTLIRTEMQLASGTAQWKRTRAETSLQRCVVDTPVTFAIEPPRGPAREVTRPCVRSGTPVPEVRPDSITELEPGLWYVDLTRVQAAQLRPMLPALAKARGVVFDVRGYPTDAGIALLPHLMRTPERPDDRWMHVARLSRPFGEPEGWVDLTWGLMPTEPLIAGSRVFLTDGRAISYAESVMGYVRDYSLGTIIGGTTAGANGNIASFTVPGGFSVVFTGMRVTRHDGRTAYHTAGVSPAIALEPTLEGIRAGRDEVLARALALLRVQP